MDISLYFHIPFCKKKCPYCHFYSIQPSQDLIKKYVTALKKEISQKISLLQNHKIITLYFGGGTPSLLGSNNIASLLQIFYQKCHVSSSAEITIETNPDDVTKEKILKLRSIGCNRLSLGVQSFDDHLLQILKRTHTSQKALHSIDIIAQFFDNLSIDLLYDIPSQTMQQWLATLHILPKLPISHVSLYNLTIEKNTPFFRKRKQLLPLFPSNRQSLHMLKAATSYLKKLQFQRYEISAFAKNNKISLHNIGYWTERNFLGFGPSAWSYFAKKRSQNVANLYEYFSRIDNNTAVEDFTEELPYPHNFKELLILHLRFLKGCNIQKLQEKWGKIPSSTEKILLQLKKEKLVKQQKDTFYLTAQGLLFYDHIAERLI